MSDNREYALEAAAAVDAKIAAGETISDLAGVPGAIKDNICIKGQKATCASKMLENFKSPYNATVIDKLMAADYVSLGKTNMDEFAMGGSTEYSYFKKTKNQLNFLYFYLNQVYHMIHKCHSLVTSVENLMIFYSYSLINLIHFGFYLANLFFYFYFLIYIYLLDFYLLY